MLAESLKFEKAKENVNRAKTGSQNQVVCDVTVNKQKQRQKKQNSKGQQRYKICRLQIVETIMFVRTVESVLFVGDIIA